MWDVLIAPKCMQNMHLISFSAGTVHCNAALNLMAALERENSGWLPERNFQGPLPSPKSAVVTVAAEYFSFGEKGERC